MIRKDFSKGWVANADLVNGPRNALIRMDNLVLDEEGVVAVRRGSLKLNEVAYTGVDIHSLFTTYLSEVRYRMAGVADTVYVNDVDLELSLPGNDDISFGGFMGQILMSRSTYHKKYDGSTARSWGVAMSGSIPTLAALAADSKTFATCDSGESPAFTVEEGSKAFAADRSETADKAIELTPDSSTGRGTITKTFASATDFTDYDGDQIGTEADLIDFYVYLTEPELMEQIALMVDVNDGSFEEDFYQYVFKRGDPVQITLDPGEILTGADIPYGPFRDDAEERMRATGGPTVRWVSPPFKGSAGWNHFTIARGKFTRLGGTSGKNWSTVKAIRLAVLAKSGGSGSAVRFDEIKIFGGMDRPLTAEYKYRYVYVFETAEYQGFSAPSDASAQIEVKANGVEVTVPADASRDTQINKVWIYRMGGYLDQYYRVGVGDVSGTGAVVVNDVMSDIDALVAFIPMEPDNAEPPDNIIAISEPHYDRIYCLTSDGYLHPSRRRNPDSFSAYQVLRIADETETPYWISKAHGGLYIGTSKDIYRLDGTGAELPDGTVDFSIRPLNLGNPPISEALAVEGNFMFYLANDGWRFFNGESSRSIMTDIDLLYKGVARHGIEAVNLTAPTARFRAAVADGILTAICPEGSETVVSNKLHRYDLRHERWYRHFIMTFRSIYREPDGTLIAGDNYGYVWQLDIGDNDEDAAISIGLRTIEDDDGSPDTRKEAQTFRALVDTGSASPPIYFYKDGQTAAGSSVISNDGILEHYEDVNSKIGMFKRIQIRWGGSVNTFRFYNYELTSREYPSQIRFWENVPKMPSGHRKRFSGGLFRVNTGGEDVTVTPVLDGSNLSTLTLNTSDFNTQSLTFDTVVGRDLWFKITGANTFEVMDVQPVVIEEYPPPTKGLTPRTNLDSEAIKVASGVEIKACTIGAARVITAVLDGVDDTTLSLTTSTDEHDTDTLQFSTLKEFTDIALKTDGDVEIFDWKPIVLYQMPRPRKVWDTGFVDLGLDDLAWIREVKIKCKAPGDLKVTPFFDGVAFTAYTKTVAADEQNKVTIFSVPIGRGYKGSQPRIVVQTVEGTEFHPFWVEFYFRPSGRIPSRKPMRVPA